MIKLVIKIEDKSTEDNQAVNVNLEKISKKDLSTATENEKTVADLIRNTLQNLTKKEE